MIKKTSLDQQDVERLEKKLKLDALELQKSIVDMQLAVGKMEERVKEASEAVPHLKEGQENLDVLLHVVVLGIRDFKKATDDLAVRFSNVEALPKKVDSTLANYNQKLQEIETNYAKMAEDMKSLGSLKDEISKNIDGSIMPAINSIKDGSEKNKMQIEDMKKDIDNFASLIKSFQRTLELTDIDSVIKKFDRINSKIINVEMQIEDLRAKTPNMSLTEKELDVINKRILELSNIVVEKDVRVKEIEATFNIIKNKIHDMNFLETIIGLKSELKEKEKMLLKTQIRLDEFSVKLEKISDDFGTRFTFLENLMKKTKHIGLIEDLAKDIEEQVSGLKGTKSVVEQLSNKVEKIYLEMVKKMTKIDEIDATKRIAIDLDSKLTVLNQTINNLKTEIEVSAKKTSKLEHELKTVSLSTENQMKALTDYPVSQPTLLEEEVKSLKEIIMKLTDENNEMKDRLDSLVTTKKEEFPVHLVAEALTKIENLEESIRYIQKKMQREMYEHPIILE